MNKERAVLKDFNFGHYQPEYSMIILVSLLAIQWKKKRKPLMKWTRATKRRRAPNGNKSGA